MQNTQISQPPTHRPSQNPFSSLALAHTVDSICCILQAEGNAYFKEKKYLLASRRYLKVFLYVNGLATQGSEMAQYAGGAVVSEDAEKQITELKVAHILSFVHIGSVGRSVGLRVMKCMVVPLTSLPARVGRSKGTQCFGSQARVLSKPHSWRGGPGASLFPTLRPWKWFIG